MRCVAYCSVSIFQRQKNLPLNQLGQPLYFVHLCLYHLYTWGMSRDPIEALAGKDSQIRSPEPLVIGYNQGTLPPIIAQTSLRQPPTSTQRHFQNVRDGRQLLGAPQKQLHKETGVDHVDPPVEAFHLRPPNRSNGRTTCDETWSSSPLAKWFGFSERLDTAAPSQTFNLILIDVRVGLF